MYFLSINYGAQFSLGSSLVHSLSSPFGSFFLFLFLFLPDSGYYFGVNPELSAFLEYYSYPEVAQSWLFIPLQSAVEG